LYDKLLEVHANVVKYLSVCVNFVPTGNISEDFNLQTGDIAGLQNASFRGSYV